jgi:formylglycine-generating enzyme required for sulfatase activity
MKYELTQDMWVAFLNHIPATYATTRNVSGTFYRNAITVTLGVYATTRGTIPMTALMSDDILSFLDWAALRPMTDLEYEKACRGPLYPVANEHAWGTALVAGSAYTYSNTGNADEAIATNYSTAANTGNALTFSTAGALSGPARSGIFAANGSNNSRLTSGATYYGIMEMTGNTTEIVVSVATSAGRLFDGLNGDGELNLSGAYNTTNWPSCSNFISRGGAWPANVASIFVSSRYNYQVSGNTYIDPCQRTYHGIRGVRTAP